MDIISEPQTSNNTNKTNKNYIIFLLKCSVTNQRGKLLIYLEICGIFLRSQEILDEIRFADANHKLCRFFNIMF